MPEDSTLGNDFTKDLDSRVLYEKFDTRPGPNNESIEGVYTFKLDYTSTEEFFKFVDQHGKWQGSGRERTWIGNKIFAKDDNIYKDREILLDYVTYKDSMFDDRSVVVVIAKYHQDLA